MRKVVALRSRTEAHTHTHTGRIVRSLWDSAACNLSIDCCQGEFGLHSVTQYFECGEKGNESSNGITNYRNDKGGMNRNCKREIYPVLTRSSKTYS